MGGRLGRRDLVGGRNPVSGHRRDGVARRRGPSLPGIIVEAGLLGLALVLGEAGQARASQVGSVTVTASPSTAGQSATYVVSFSSTSALVATSGTITLDANGGQPGTVFPAPAASYVITDLTQPGGSGPVSAAPVLANSGSRATITVPGLILPGDALKVTVSGMTNPPLASTAQTLAVSTSADTTAVSSSPYAITASPDGSGGLTMSPASVTDATPTTLSFTYTAAAGGTSSGKVAVIVPSGWTAPSTTAGTAGYTTASAGTVSVSGQSVTVSGVTLPSGATLGVVYGSGGGANRATSTASVGISTFAASEQSTTAGTLTNLASSPAVSVTYAPDGTGALSASPASVLVSTPTTLTFTYTAAPGGTSSGKVAITVPSGWTAPSTTSGTAGYTTASTGTVSVSGQNVTVSGVTLAANATTTVTYGSGGAGNSVVAPSSSTTSTFAASEQSTTAGTLTSLASSPAVSVTYAPDGTGVLSASPASVLASTPTTVTFTYTAAAGGTSSGKVALAVPSGWTAPSTTSGNPGYTTASTGTLSVAGQSVTVSERDGDGHLRFGRRGEQRGDTAVGGYVHLRGIGAVDRHRDHDESGLVPVGGSFVCPRRLGQLRGLAHLGPGLVGNDRRLYIYGRGRWHGCRFGRHHDPDQLDSAVDHAWRGR
jgi:hypothetical protein